VSGSFVWGWLQCSIESPGGERVLNRGNTYKIAGFSPGVHTLLNADRISNLQENWALYQGTTLVEPYMVENMPGLSS
jgi:hypothetical protein